MTRVFPSIVAKIFFFLISMMLPQLISTAQNLVPNPSFEQGTDYCPETKHGYEFPVKAPPWTDPTDATPDIYYLEPGSTCHAAMPGSPQFSSDRMGSQLPRTGSRCAGIYTSFESFSPVDGYREYMEIKLSQPLTVGEYYLASMYVSLAEGPWYASNNIGFYFSDAQIEDRTTTYRLHYSPQVYAARVIADTVKWVRVCGVFKATSAAQYVTIGNFFSEPETKTADKGGRWTFKNDIAYYFVDDVSVERMSSLNQPLPLALVNPICEKQSAQLTALDEYDTITWARLQDPTKIIGKGNSLQVSPSATTTYLGVAKACGITYRDTITVKVNPLPTINLGQDTTLCPAQQLLLDAGQGYASYVWQDNSASEELLVSQPGKYSVSVKTIFGCESGDDILVSYIDPPKVNLGADRFECSNFKPLQAFGNQKTTYHWSSGAKDSVFVPSSPGVYWCAVKNQCGTASDTVHIYSMGDAFAPNVVTLNGDHLNDRFRIDKVPDTSFGVKIINRWGDVIFSDNAYQGTWPDKEDVPEGVYYFLLSYPGCPDKKGWVQLLK